VRAGDATASRSGTVVSGSGGRRTSTRLLRRLVTSAAVSAAVMTLLAGCGGAGKQAQLTSRSSVRTADTIQSGTGTTVRSTGARRASSASPTAPAETATKRSAPAKPTTARRVKYVRPTPHEAILLAASSTCAIGRFGAPSIPPPTSSVAKLKAYARRAESIAARTAKMLGRLPARHDHSIAHLIADYRHLASVYAETADSNTSKAGLFKALIGAEQHVAVDAFKTRVPACSPPPPVDPAVGHRG
jgi:hypothetical protein